MSQLGNGDLFGQKGDIPGVREHVLGQPVWEREMGLGLGLHLGGNAVVCCGRVNAWGKGCLFARFGQRKHCLGKGYLLG